MEYYNSQSPDVHPVQARRFSPGDLHRAGGAPLRIGLRLWGFEDRQVESWFDDLRDLDGRLRWELVRQRDGAGADLVIHLVKSSSALLSSFCWNCAGADHTMRQSQGKSPVHIAIFAGDANRLPAERAGLWVFAGNRSPKAALQELTQTVIIPRLLKEIRKGQRQGRPEVAGVEKMRGRR